MEVITTTIVELTLEEAKVIKNFLDSLDEALPDEVDAFMFALP